MKRELVFSPRFIRAAGRLRRRRPQLRPALERALMRLEQDCFQPPLNTHKLKGELDDLWACSVTHDLRILFEFVSHNGHEAILLQTLGTHDEVY